MKLTEEQLELAKKLGYDECPFSVDERESAVKLIFTTYQKPLNVEFVKSIISQVRHELAYMIWRF